MSVLLHPTMCRAPGDVRRAEIDTGRFAICGFGGRVLMLSAAEMAARGIVIVPLDSPGDGDGPEDAA